MPIYEYRCAECGHELEKLQKMSDAPLVDCPACSKPGLRKLVSAAGFRLKGNGWYETDFKQGKKKNVVKNEAGATDKAAAGEKKTTVEKKTAGGDKST
jgi:putative FmdB family regulatory protein